MAIESGDTVTFEYSVHLEDGSLVDASREPGPDEDLLPGAQHVWEPLTATVGAGDVIPGLEEALVGLSEEETASVTVEPEDAYGEWDEGNVHAYDLEQFEQVVGQAPPPEGTYMRFGDGHLVEIVSVSDDEVTVDYNHRLAGETLHFEIEIVEVE